MGAGRTAEHQQRVSMADGTGGEQGAERTTSKAGKETFMETKRLQWPQQGAKSG